jgi:FixJ family two-component response regulator
MPGLSGDELAQRMRARAPHLPVVFISGYTDDVRPETLPGRLLLKPFRSRDVVSLVAEVLGEAGADGPVSRRNA